MTLLVFLKSFVHRRDDKKITCESTSGQGLPVDEGDRMIDLKNKKSFIEIFPFKHFKRLFSDQIIKGIASKMPTKYFGKTENFVSVQRHIVNIPYYLANVILYKIANEFNDIFMVMLWVS